MMDFAAEKTSLSMTGQALDWFVIEFSQLGFIGKMFKGTSLPTLIQFMLMFYNDKPGDWLLTHIIETKVCRVEERVSIPTRQNNLNSYPIVIYSLSFRPQFFSFKTSK